VRGQRARERKKRGADSREEHDTAWRAAPSRPTPDLLHSHATHTFHQALDAATTAQATTSIRACSAAAAAAAVRPSFPAWSAAADAADAPPPPDDTTTAGGGGTTTTTTTTATTAATATPHSTPPVADPSTTAASSLTPRAVVAALDSHIVGQADAKRAVANALRTRWRRHRVSPPSLREEIMPKNILMVGPTGCGKTEVARRLAKLAAAPFIKVEATKFTEVGFHGRDVDQIIRDLVDNAIALCRDRARARAKAAVAAAVEARLLAALCGEAAGTATLDTFRALYRSGALDDRRVVLDLPVGLGGGGGGGSPRPPVPSGGLASLDTSALPPGTSVPAAMAEVIARVDRLVGGNSGRGGGGPGGGLMGGVIGGGGNSGRTERRELTIGEARPLVEEAEADRAVDPDAVVREAVAVTQSDGIVFIDEIDKIVVSSDVARYGADASSTGVQRDLLPLLDGSIIPTKYGPIDTQHILFIASGAFHTCKPGDMLAELQGRLPIRVELKGLTEDDFYRILTEPVSNLIAQQAALLATEGVDLSFTDGAIRAVARIAAEVNTAVDNIGARRLHSILERLLEDVSFSAPDTVAAAAQAAGASASGGGGPAPALRASVVVDEAMVQDRLAALLEKQDLSRFVL
jgi:ATP-dependent HslUV protease ATP-binding subunit HslU